MSILIENNKDFNNEDLIKIFSLKKKYNKNTVLDIDYFKIKRGKVYLLLGQNGSGKSTLVKSILGLIKYEGRIEKEDIRISYLPERIPDLPLMKGKKFLDCIKQDKTYSDIENDFASYFEFDKNKYICNLSKGNIQKMFIISSILNNSDLYIFDEPLNGLDDFSRDRFISILNLLKDNHKTIIITSHYKIYYNNIYDYIINMKDGRIV